VNKTLEEEIKAWDNDGTLQSLHEVLIEMKRREKLSKWKGVIPKARTPTSTIR
jgi:hypothetical protein